MRSARFPRRFFLCLLLLLLATPSFAQVQFLASDGNLYGEIETGFYSYNPTTGQQTILNASAPGGLVLCLERSDGTLLGIAVGGANGYQAIDITLAGAIRTIDSFPASATYEPACPALANDGNYYGSTSEGGDYNYGYIYQLTSAGKITAFYNFTGGVDGTGPFLPPIQASDGNLYWYFTDRLLRYSPTTGLTPTTLAYSANDNGQPLLEASDGNFYAAGGGGVVQITPKGTVTRIYTPPTADSGAENGTLNNLYLTGNASYPLAVLLEYSYYNYDTDYGCEAGGNYFPMQAISLVGVAGPQYFSIGTDEYGFGQDGLADADEYTLHSFLFGGNGSFYTDLTDENTVDDSYEYDACNQVITNNSYNTTFTAPGAAPITMSLSQTHVKPGGSATLTWSVNNAYSDTLLQCYGFGSALSGKVALTGSATVSAPSAGTYVSSIVCGGTETGLATLTAGNATLAITANSPVNQGSNVTLGAVVTNPGTPGATGKVNFLLGSTVIGSATMVNNSATLTESTAGVPPGTYNVVASYLGDANYGPATSTAAAITVIGKSATSTSLTPTSQTILQGANVSLTAKVVGSSTHGAPTGSVKFLVGTTTVGTVALSGENSTTAEATLTASTASIAAGTYSVTASYPGDSNNLASNANTVTVTVSPATPVTLAISPNPVPADTSFTLTATIHGKDSPSGTVFFYVNGTQDLTSGNVSNGVATVTVPAGALASGTYQMTATYAGDANNPTGTSPAVSLTVQ